MLSTIVVAEQLNAGRTSTLAQAKRTSLSLTEGSLGRVLAAIAQITGVSINDVDLLHPRVTTLRRLPAYAIDCIRVRYLHDPSRYASLDQAIACISRDILGPDCDSFR